MTRRIQAVIVCGLIVFAACGKGGKSASPTPSTASATAAQATTAPTSMPSGGPHISITSPTEGARVPGGTVKVITQVSGFQLVDKIGQKAQAGEGHIVYYMGTGYRIPNTKGQTALAGGHGAFVSYPSARQMYRWTSVPSGSETFVVQLVNNDNTPLDPPQAAQAKVVVNP